MGSNLLGFVAKEPHRLSLAHRSIEPGHLLYSALTCPPSANAQYLKSRHPFVHNNLCTTTYQFFWGPQQKYYPLGTSPMEWGLCRCAFWLENTTRLCTFILDIGTHTPGMALTRTAWVWLNRLRTNVWYFRPAYTNGVWPLLRPMSVVQKDRPSTMLSSVQSIDLTMDYTAWGFWMMRQSNGCSTPAPWSSAAQQWIERTTHAMKKNQPALDFSLVYSCIYVASSLLHRSICWKVDLNSDFEDHKWYH